MNARTRVVPASVVREIYTAEHPYAIGAMRGVCDATVRCILIGRTYSDITESLTRWVRK